MEYFLRFASITTLYFLLPLFLALVWWRAYKHKSGVYKYSLGHLLDKHNLASAHPYKRLLFVLRFYVLLALVLLIGKPQLVDSRSKVRVHGIDIMLALDASGSMQFQDFSDDNRSRFQVAQDEANHFIEKRDNDAMGLVFFGKEAISRCPLTLDKHILKNIVQTTQLGDIDPTGTVIATALLTAINRLKNSQAKSKVIILLTDGEPSAEDKEPHVAIEVAKNTT